MNALDRHALDEWHKIVRNDDPAALDAIVHADAVFKSPVIYTPQRGKAITIKYLTAAVATLGKADFAYVGEWFAEHSVVLEFECQIDGIAINGIDIIPRDGTTQSRSDDALGS